MRPRNTTDQTDDRPIILPQARGARTSDCHTHPRPPVDRQWPPASPPRRTDRQRTRMAALAPTPHFPSLPVTGGHRGQAEGTARRTTDGPGAESRAQSQPRTPLFRRTLAQQRAERRLFLRSSSHAPNPDSPISKPRGGITSSFPFFIPPLPTGHFFLGYP